MKIGIEVQRLFREKKFGIEKSALDLIRAIRDIEPKHEYVVFAKNDKDVSCLSTSENLKIRKVRGKLFADFEQIHLPVAASREQIDILHCTGNTTPYFSPVPVIQTLHDVIFMDEIPSGDSLYQRVGNHYRRRVVPVVSARSSAIITVSQFEKQRIIDRIGISGDKIHVVYNGIDKLRFHPHYSPEEKQFVRSKYELPDEFILFLGNEACRKNPARVIEAYIQYSTLTDNPVPLVTPGLSRRYVGEVARALNASLDLSRIITPGYISDEDLPVLYGMAKVFLFPSLSEGFGMPMVEAMACGAPVVTSRISCLPEIAGHAAILADPFNAADIATGMLTLLNSDELRAEKTEAGLRNAKRFSWKRAAESVLGLYENVYAETLTAQKIPGFLQKLVFAKH